MMQGCLTRLASQHHTRPLVGVFEKSFYKRPCQFWAINAHKMDPRTTQWLQERRWDAPTKSLAWHVTYPESETLEGCTSTTVFPPFRSPCIKVSPQSGHADAEARRSVLTALPCATLVTTHTASASRGAKSLSTRLENLQRKHLDRGRLPVPLTLKRQLACRQA